MKKIVQILSLVVIVTMCLTILGGWYRTWVFLGLYDIQRKLDQRFLWNWRILVCLRGKLQCGEDRTVFGTLQKRKEQTIF